MANFKYYPAKVAKHKEKYTITFPDVPGCSAEGVTFDKACGAAYNRLQITLYRIAAKNENIPNTTDINDIKPEENECVTMIPFDLDILSEEVRKSVSIPKWLETEAKIKKVVLSDVLKEALERKLFPE